MSDVVAADSDNAQSFNDISDRVQGTTPPTANSDAPVIGAMHQLNGAAAPVLLAPNGTGSTATVYTTRDGNTFTKAVSVSLPGMQPGPSTASPALTEATPSS